jgi:hypothetical protein
MAGAAGTAALREDFMNIRVIVIRMLAAFGIIVAMANITFAEEQAIVQFTGSGSAARALFPANDLLDWGQLGPPCPNVGQLCIPNGSVATSNKGIALTIFSPSGGFNRADEGTIAWSGHFQTGDHVIFAGATPGTITFTLRKPIAGIGFELGPDSNSGSATVQILDSKGKLLSSITQPAVGGACTPPCNDAAFFGFYDPQGRIASVAISPNTEGGFAENQVSLIDQTQLSFAGTPGQANCQGQSIATLVGLYGGLDGASAALGFSSVSALQNAVMAYCAGQ